MVDGTRRDFGFLISDFSFWIGPINRAGSTQRGRRDSRHACRSRMAHRPAYGWERRGGLYVFVAEEFLDGTDTCPEPQVLGVVVVLKQVGGK